MVVEYAAIRMEMTMRLSTKLRNWTTAVSLTICLALPSATYAARDEEPSAGEMAADIVVARPVGFVLTTLGAAAFVVSLPFSALGGNVSEAAEQLVMKPGKETFVRCLGCRSSGRYQSPND